MNNNYGGRHLNYMAVTNLVVATTGADPGIFVRGVQLSLKFEEQKKKKKKKGRRRRENEEYGGGGCGGSSPSAEVWFKSTFQTFIYIQVFVR